MSESGNNKNISLINNPAEMLNEIAENYSGQTEIQALIGVIGLAIPAIGIVSSYMANHGTVRLYERLNLLVSAMDIRLRSLEVRSIEYDKHFLESDVGFDMAIKAIQGAAQTRSKIKIEEYAQILIVASVDKSCTPILEDYLNAIGELEEKELLFLKRMYEFQKVGRLKEHANLDTWKEYVKWDDMLSGLTEDESLFLLLRLSKTGMIRETAGYVGGASAFEITEIFRKVMQAIQVL